MKSAAVKRMRSALLETPRPACFVASQAAASRNPNTVFNIGGIGPLALQAGVTALHESGEEQEDLSWIPGAIRRRPAAALRRLERVVSGTARSEACAVLAGSRGQSARGLRWRRRLRALRLRFRNHFASADHVSVPATCPTRLSCRAADPLLCVSIVGAARTRCASERAARRFRARFCVGLPHRKSYSPGSRVA